MKLGKCLMVLVAVAMGCMVVNAQSTTQKLAANKATISLADARSRIDKAIASPAVMTAIMQHLSAEDQKAFLSEVNRAITDMPASPEERAALFLNVNHAAMKGAAKGNLGVLVAEVFATVPVENLPIISERFAEDLFNRSADPSTSYSDQEFVRIAKATMEVVNKRVSDVENADVRSTFAALMFIRAANADFSEKIVEPIIASLPESAREIAVKDGWVTAAKNGSYEGMLGVADAGVQPIPEQVIFIAGPQNLEAMLADLTGANVDPARLAASYNPIVDAVQKTFYSTGPHLGHGGALDEWMIEGVINKVEKDEGEGPSPHPGPYGYQRL